MRPIIILSLFITACATPYGPSGGTGGYSHQQVSENSYVVTFTGNGYTTKERATDFALLRAAEIGDKLGFTHMVVAGEADQSTSRMVSLGAVTQTNASAYSYGNYATGQATSYTTPSFANIRNAGTSIGVLFFEGSPEGRYLEVHKIKPLMNMLKAKYLIDQETGTSSTGNPYHDPYQ